MASLQQIKNNLRDYTTARILASLAILVVLAIVATLLEVYSASGFADLKRSQQFNDRLGGSLDNVLTDLRDADAAVRNYIVLADPEALDNYNRTARTLPEELRQLQEITAGTGTAGSAAAIQRQTSEKLADLQAVIDLRATGDSTGASDLLRTTQGKRLVDQIRGNIITLEADQNRRIRAEQDAITTRMDSARIISIILLLSTLTTISVVLILFVRAIAAEKELERAKDDFLSLASHQLRTPASGIKSVISMVVDEEFGELNERQKYFLKRAGESNQVMLDLVEDMLNVARFESGKFSLNKTQFSMQDIVQATIFEQRLQIENKQQQLVVNLPEQPITIQGDEVKMRMVIGNIVDNARKYTKKRGRISITLATSGTHAIITIEDNGVGINQGDVNDIFNRFARTHNELSEEVGGSGLGLYLAKIIVELHNGSITVDSRKGHGTVFTVSLPQIGKSHAT